VGEGLAVVSSQVRATRDATGPSPRYDRSFE